MPRFYIEIPHEEDTTACLRAIKVLQETGSHFLTNACFGCRDGDHFARMIIDLDSKNEAQMIVPRAYRAQARVVQLNSFSAEEVNELLQYHEAKNP